MKESESESHLVLSNSVIPWTIHSLGQNTGVGRFSLLQGIVPTQGLNPGLPHCRRILYHLSHKGSLRIFPTQELNWGFLHYRRIFY